jgi:hypothetical protein
MLAYLYSTPAYATALERRGRTDLPLGDANDDRLLATCITDLRQDA